MKNPFSYLPFGLLCLPALAVAFTPEERYQDVVNTLFALKSETADLLLKAQGDRDAVKATCVADKLNIINIALDSARHRYDALESALNNSDNTAAGHEATTAESILTRAQTAATEAKTCGGREFSRSTEDSSVKMESPILPEDLPTIVTPAALEPPACSSCFR